MKIYLSKENVKGFNEVFKKAKTIMEEANVIFNGNGVEVYGIDGSSVQFIQVKIDSEFFTDLECEESEEVQTRINLKDFTKKLDRCKDDTTLEIGNEEMKIMSGKKNYTVRYKVDELSKKPNIDSMEFPIIVDLNTQEVSEALNDVKMNEDMESIEIDFRDNQITFMENKSTAGKSKSTIDTIIENKAFQNSTVQLNASMFSNMMYKKADKVTMSVNPEQSICMRYNENNIDMLMMLALMV